MGTRSLSPHLKVEELRLGCLTSPRHETRFEPRSADSYFQLIFEGLSRPHHYHLPGQTQCFVLFCFLTDQIHFYLLPFQYMCIPEGSSITQILGPMALAGRLLQNLAQTIYCFHVHELPFP